MKIKGGRFPMVIGRERLREHPQPTFFCTTTKNKVRGKSHVISCDVTSGQACAMVRSSGSSANTTVPIYY